MYLLGEVLLVGPVAWCLCVGAGRYFAAVACQRLESTVVGCTACYSLWLVWQW